MFCGFRIGKWFMPLCNSVSSLPAGRQVCETPCNRKKQELKQSTAEKTQRITEVLDVVFK